MVPAMSSRPMTPNTNSMAGAVWAGVWSGALAAIAWCGLPSLRAAGLGLDAAPRAEVVLLAGLAAGGACFGLLARRLAWSAARLGLVVAVAAFALAVLQGAGLLTVGDRLPVAWIAVTLGLALGHVAPARGWLAVLAAAVGAVVVVAAGPLCTRLLPFPARAAGLLLAPPIAILLGGRGGAGRVLDGGLALLAGGLGIAVALAIEPPPKVSAGLVALASAGDTVAAYDPGTQELQLWQRGELVAAEGPERPRSAVLATTTASLARPGDRILALGVGLGRLPAAFERAGLPAVEIVHARTQLLPLLPRLLTAGAVAPPALERGASGAGRGARRQPVDWSGTGLDGSGASSARLLGWLPRSRLAGALPTLRRLPADSRQFIVLGDDLGADPGRGGALPWQCSLEAQRELRRVAGNGVVLQPFALDRTPPARLRLLFGAAAAVHPWNGVLAIGDCGVLLSAARRPAFSRANDLQGWSDDACWQAHLARLGSGSDVQRAWLGTVAVDRVAAAWPPPVVESGGSDDERGAQPATERRATLRVLHDCLEPAPALTGQASSLLLWSSDLASRMRAFERQLRLADATAPERERVRRAALAFLPTGARSAALQAALALPDENGRALRDPHQASLTAFAIDPTFHAGRPALLGDLPLPQRRVGHLADFAFLPPPERLRELCVGRGPLAIALRSRFPTACARVLVAALRRGPLEPLAAEALRELADPLVLAMAGRAVAPRAGERELLALWRRDLAMPRALRALRERALTDRADLAGALTGRQDGLAIATLADLLLDDAESVRRTAGEALFVTAAGAIEFDAKWPRGKRFIAAERLRSMHNRAP